VTSSDSVPLSQQWPPARLTRREREVLLLVVTGLSNKEIARRLGLSTGTVKLHMHKIFQKTGAKRRSELMAQMSREAAPPKRSFDNPADMQDSDAEA
jgi:DNA-binding NarL/FixJ family response regulator